MHPWPLPLGWLSSCKILGVVLLTGGHFQCVLNDLTYFEIEHLITTITVTPDLLLHYADLEGVLQQWAMYQVRLVDIAGWRLPLFRLM